MQKWELMTFVTDYITGRGGVTSIWSVKDKKTGLTEWDQLTKLANEGYELVSVTPINHQGWTYEVLYTFKRPIEEGK